MKSVTIPYRQENHGDFDAEWPVQRKVTGWWYITGFFSDLPGSRSACAWWNCCPEPGMRRTRSIPSTCSGKYSWSSIF